MKKGKIISLVLVFSLACSLLTPTALAANRSSSQILADMEVQAKAALLMDADTDVVLYEQNAEEQVYPASITKVMTAICVMEAVEAGQLALDDQITAQDDCWEGLDYTSSNANIKPGEIMSVEDLLYCLLVASANEAANILAEEVSGSISAFVDEMNQTAAELGCTGTHFVNTNGMPDEDHYTTCNDLYLMAKACLSYDTLRTIVKSPECYIEATNVSERRHYFNTNGLLSNMNYMGYVYDKCIGIKTGSTEAAGYCLLSAAESGGKTLIAVVMGCENPKDENGKIQRLQFSESSRLLKWGFENFSTITILDTVQPEGKVDVTMSDETDQVSVVPEHSLEAELPNDITADSFQHEVHIISSVQAPVKKGDVLGSVTLTLDGKEYGTVNLVAANDVEVSQLLLRQAQLQELIGKWWMKIVFMVAALLILIILLRIFVFRPKRRSRYGAHAGTGRGGYRGGRRR